MDAIHDEIETMIKHSTEDMMSEITTLVEEAHEDLTVQCKEIVRLAFSERRADLRKSISLATPVSGLKTFKELASPATITKIVPFGRRFSSTKVLPTVSDENKVEDAGSASAR